MEARANELEAPKDKFDLRTHVFSRKGTLIRTNHYRMYVRGDVKVFERPVGSGNLYYENNEPAGRVENVLNTKTQKYERKFNYEAQHKEYVAPLTGSEKVHFELEDLKSKNSEILKELEAIRAEREALAAKLEAKQPELKNAADALAGKSSKEIAQAQTKYPGN